MEFAIREWSLVSHLNTVVGAVGSAHSGTTSIHVLLISSLAGRQHSSLPLLLPCFRHITHLDFTPCCDELQDSHLQLASEWLKNLQTLSLGNLVPLAGDQVCISNLGFVGFVNTCSMLEEIAYFQCPVLLDSGTEAISGICKKLRFLYLQYCYNLFDVALDSLKNC